MGVLDDKVAIVTGSARGIGRATAELLSEQGAKVLINDLDGDVAEQTAGEIGGDTVVYAGDLTKNKGSDQWEYSTERQRSSRDRRAASAARPPSCSRSTARRS